jgi:hypothetical protein
MSAPSSAYEQTGRLARFRPPGRRTFAALRTKRERTYARTLAVDVFFGAGYSADVVEPKLDLYTILVRDCSRMNCCT